MRVRVSASAYAATVLIVLCCAVAPALAKMRVALLGIDGRNGEDVRTAVEEVLAREVTVLSEGLFNPMRSALAYLARAGGYFLLITEDWPPFSYEEGAPAPAAGELSREAASRRS